MVFDIPMMVFVYDNTIYTTNNSIYICIFVSIVDANVCHTRLNLSG